MAHIQTHDVQRLQAVVSIHGHEHGRISVLRMPAGDGRLVGGRGWPRRVRSSREHDVDLCAVSEAGAMRNVNHMDVNGVRK